MIRERKRLGEILIDFEVVTPIEVDRVLEALERRRVRMKKFGQMARDMGLIEEEHILAALAVQMELLPDIHRLSLDEVLEGLLAVGPVGG